MVIPVKTSTGKYDVIIERGALVHADRYFDLDRRVLIVTDSGVPAEYARTLSGMCSFAFVVTVEQGEQSKSFDNFRMLLSKMIELGFTRSDCVCAVGGGVVGDLAGFTAACYMRGVDFYNIPTTLLSQVDSSVGGKTAIDLCGVKNPVGAFHPARAVIIDPDLLATLDPRQLACGFAEALKMSLTSDADLFGIFERGEAHSRIDEVIERSIMIKRSVVEQDEHESGLRRILNFGHTLGHGIEASDLTLFHGECVALGMLPMCAGELRARLIPILASLALPYDREIDKASALEAITHDKKSAGGTISIVTVSAPGSYKIEKADSDRIKELLDYFKGAAK